ncbi:MAG: phosphatidate cytidylyltransferase [Dactylosporangium sp.]|nr:phosphatidate cytidylyltransferase [Dactylosporangium sp.]NNJ59948.1 phosphatidate cytidylyltransferase [Dactylosporangium sp.]
MPQRDPDWDDRPEFGHDATAGIAYPQRRASRYSSHSVDEPTVVSASYQPDGADPLATWGAPPSRPPALPEPDPPEPGGEEEPGTPDQQRPGNRAGRNLPAAIAVGVLLGGSVVAALLIWRPAFVVIALLAVVGGTWEMTRAVHQHGPRPPAVPLLAGGAIMIGLAWFGGPSVLPLGLIATAVAILVWRLADGAPGYQRDVTVAILIATYIPFLASFAVLLVRPDDGHLRVLVALIGVVVSDTAGYATGVFLGRRPMAPSISPKKSWEGFTGSVVFTAGCEALLFHWLFDAAPWQGALFGLAVSMASVLGDLVESLLKRDLGVKDMSSLLPGHGGLMDRLDSILLAAPVAYAVLLFVVPVAS